MKTSIAAFAIAAAAVVVSLAVAQDKTPAPQGAPAQPAPAQPAGRAPRIVVEPEAFDFGRALVNKELVKEFVIRNLGNADLTIEGIATSCGCTAALMDPAQKVIKPGGSAPLRVTLSTKSTGPTTKEVIVTSSDPARNRVVLKVSANAVPESPAQP